MFNRRLPPYVIVICIFAVLSLSYVGYRVYKDHVKFKEFISDRNLPLPLLAIPPPACGGLGGVGAVFDGDILLTMPDVSATIRFRG